MVRVISSPRLIPAAGSPPKLISEYIGRQVSETSQVSIARMNSPPGWSEPGQIPEFDEYSLVLSGTLIITSHSGAYEIRSGQAAIVPAGEWVQYSSPDGAEYLAICVPAFSTDLVHRDAVITPGNQNEKKSGDIIFEVTGKSDLFRIENLWTKLRDYHVSQARNFKAQLSARSFSQRCDEILITNEKRDLLVHLARVKDTDELAGFCISSAASGEYGEIESIYVDKPFRSRGIGTMFMNHACAWMKEIKVCEFTVGVCEGNEESFRFYERFGFYPRRTLLIRKNKSKTYPGTFSNTFK